MDRKNIVKVMTSEDVQALMSLNPDALIHIDVEEVENHGLQARLVVLTDEPDHIVSEFFSGSTPIWAYDRARDWQGVN